jgi:hypothetical protein
LEEIRKLSQRDQWISRMDKICRGGETVETEGPFKEETARHMNNKWF